MPSLHGRLPRIPLPAFGTMRTAFHRRRWAAATPLALLLSLCMASPLVVGDLPDRAEYHRADYSTMMRSMSVPDLRYGRLRTEDSSTMVSEVGMLGSDNDMMGEIVPVHEDMVSKRAHFVACSNCSAAATMGIADEDGGWGIRMCAACSSGKQNQGYGEWLKLSGRCVKCTKMAYFALVKRKGRGSAEGGSSADASTGGVVMHCKFHREPLEIDIRHPTCAAPDCNTQPSFAKPGQVARHCMLHSEPGEVAISGWRCEKCSKAASFGEASIGRAVRCRTHKHHNDVDLKNKRCRHQGCTKHPAFGNYEELGGRPQYCSAHKMPHHYNVKNRMCLHEVDGMRVCTTQATFGDPLSRIMSYCSKHKRANDVDLRNKRCRHPEGCDLLPSYGDGLGGMRATYCSAHKKPRDVVQWPQRHACQYAHGCTSQARYGTIGEGAQFCKAHRIPGQENLKLQHNQAQVPKRRSRREAMATSVEGMGLHVAEEEEGEVLEAEVFGSSREELGIDEADIAREIMNKFGNLTTMANEFSFFKDEPGSYNTHSYNGHKRGVHSGRDFDVAGGGDGGKEEMGEQEMKAELERMGVNDLSFKDLLAFRLNMARQEGKGMG